MNSIDTNEYRALVSPKHTLSDVLHGNTSTRIDAFYNRIDDWQLRVAEKCCSIDGSGCAVLSIILSYFEMISLYTEGRGDNEEKASLTFKKGLFYVFPELEKKLKARYSTEPEIEELVDSLYDKARCGLYHAGMSRSGVVIYTRMDEAIDLDDEENWLINPRVMVSVLRQHLKNYMQSLHTNDSYRKKFDQRFMKDRCWGISEALTERNLYGASLRPIDPE